MNAYEIYIRNPTTGERCWAIKLVWSNRSMINSYPHFDCVIAINDCQPTEYWI